MKTFDYQFIIVGGGAAGFAAAIKADELKIKTLMISGGNVPLGGTCINVGCMPTKRLLAVAEAYWNAKHSKFDGVESKVENFDFTKVVESKDALISKLQGKAYAGTLKFLVYVTLKEGDVKFIDEHTIEVVGPTSAKASAGKEKITGEKFLISTGSSTFIPPIPDLLARRSLGEAGADAPYLTNIEALNLKKLPESMIVLGGGPLGLEFAQIFNRFGAKVTVLQSADRIADREEPELAEFLRKKLEAEGITIYTSVKTKSVGRHNGLIEVQADVEGPSTPSTKLRTSPLGTSKKIIINAEKLLVATGVRANTEFLNLQKIGVRIGERGGIITNEFLQSDLPHIFAAGDVVDQVEEESHSTGSWQVNPKLETVAGREGFVAASNLLENKGVKTDFRAVPHAIFTDPPLASVGLTDAQIVKQSGLVCSCRTLNLDLVPKAHILEAADGLIKMAIDSKTEEVVGIHMAGARADEIISIASFIVKNRMKLDDIIENTFIFPTMAESIKWVAQSFRKDVSKLSCCTE